MRDAGVDTIGYLLKTDAGLKVASETSLKARPMQEVMHNMYGSGLQ